MAKRDRDWFRRMAPKGVRLRMMEPGEAPALQAIRAASVMRPGGDAASAQPADSFVAWLLQHEIFVAATKAGTPIGYAAARDLGDLYWLAGLHVLPDHARRGVGRALVGAVAARAGWFFHRALGLTTARATAPFFEPLGFTAIPRQDLPAMLEERLVVETPPDGALDDRLVLVRWL